MDQPCIARRVRITGHVQGVFFRAWTKQQADALGTTGWVRNLPDGSVEALLCGSDASVAALTVQLRRGPPAAEVERLEVSDAAVDDTRSFTVLR